MLRFMYKGFCLRLFRTIDFKSDVKALMQFRRRERTAVCGCVSEGNSLSVAYVFKIYLKKSLNEADKLTWRKFTSLSREFIAAATAHIPELERETINLSTLLFFLLAAFKFIQDAHQFSKVSSTREQKSSSLFYIFLIKSSTEWL